MKTMARIVLYLMILCFCGCSSKKDEVIIAVNTGNRVGYFTDSKGNIIIDKQFDGVSSFSNGLAKVKQNGDDQTCQAIQYIPDDQNDQGATMQDPAYLHDLSHQ